MLDTHGRLVSELEAPLADCWMVVGSKEFRALILEEGALCGPWLLISDSVGINQSPIEFAVSTGENELVGTLEDPDCCFCFLSRISTIYIGIPIFGL